MATQKSSLLMQLAFHVQTCFSDGHRFNIMRQIGKWIYWSHSDSHIHISSGFKPNPPVFSYGQLCHASLGHLCWFIFLVLTQFQQYKYFFNDSEKHFFLHSCLKALRQKPQSISLGRDCSKGLSTQVLIPMADHMATGSGMRHEPVTPALGKQKSGRYLSSRQFVSKQIKPTTITDRDPANFNETVFPIRWWHTGIWNFLLCLA